MRRRRIGWGREREERREDEEREREQERVRQGDSRRERCYTGNPSKPGKCNSSHPPPSPHLQTGRSVSPQTSRLHRQ